MGIQIVLATDIGCSCLIACGINRRFSYRVDEVPYKITLDLPAGIAIMQPPLAYRVALPG
ncbi:MAG: hypothetical protein ABI113_23660 [Mucilaginibacter sp.]